MVIERGAVRLERLTSRHIELVRQKRNLKAIRDTMEYREEITPEMQVKWFASIDNDRNYYFLIEVNEAFIGLISAGDIDWEKGIVNNGGIFIWDEGYLHAPEVLQASVLLTDFGYYAGLRKNRIKVLRDNERAIAFNKSLGYVLLPNQEHIYNQEYELPAPEIYFNATSKIRNIASMGYKMNVKLTEREYRLFEPRTREAVAAHQQDISFQIIS